MTDENKQPDPVAFGANPTGATLLAKPSGISRINKNGYYLVGAAFMVAAGVAGVSFSHMGDASDPNNLPTSKAKTAPTPIDTAWYTDKPDTVAPADKTVPDLTGQGKTLAEAVTAQPTDAVNAKGQGQPGQTQNQQISQEEQERQQRLRMAMTAQLDPQRADGMTDNTAQTPTAPTALPTAHGSQNAAVPVGVDQDPNKQLRKEQFLKDQNAFSTAYSKELKMPPLAEFELKAGSIIPAALIGKVNSDTPGQMEAQVRENVYDTKTGKYLLIPAGTKVIGLYDSQVAYGQERLVVAWNRLIYPDGSSFNLKGMPGADMGGEGGLHDEVDNHYVKIFGSAILMSLISAGVQLSQPNNGNNGNGSYQNPTVGGTVAGALGQQLGQTGLAITQKNLQIQPTLKLPVGHKFVIKVTADMVLPPMN
ncbi:MAG: TrbI/VirB10 family protein [Burkholderia sp.]